MPKFEVVSKYKDKNINLPIRKTANSAGYDFEAAEDVIVPSYLEIIQNLRAGSLGEHKSEIEIWTLDEIKNLTKKVDGKPTLIPTGIKCYLEPDTYLNMAIRSSSPLKYWIVLANGQGVIDADYADNPDNEGEIFFQVINFSPFPIIIKKGEIIGQGIIQKYYTTDDDNATGDRLGGFGSTTK